MRATPAQRRLNCVARNFLVGALRGDVATAKTNVKTLSVACGASPPSDGTEQPLSQQELQPLDRVQIKHVREFISRGVTVVGPEEHGLPQVEIHSRIWENLKAGKGGDGIGTRMPELVQVLNSPGMVRALDAIMGVGWAIVPFIHSGFGGSGKSDQTWCAQLRSGAPSLQHW